MRVPQLDLVAQHNSLKDELLPAVLAVVESQRFIMGEAVAQLEEAIAGLCQVRCAVACASGTDALFLSYRALELQPGDEVITTPFTFFATAGAIVNAGGTPVFVDVDPETLNIDPAAIEAAVTPRTRAIVPVHLFGQLAAMDRILPVAEGRGIPVIEDAAQAIGARRRVGGAWRMAGSMGLMSTLSFFPSKNLGCWGDGGMVVTDDEEVAARLRLLRTHGGAKQYHHDMVGTNSRLDTIHAAVLLGKLPHLASWNEGRRRVAAHYDRAFASVKGVTPLTADPANEHIYHQYTVRAERRDALRDFLREREIGSAVYYPKPLHLQPCFGGLGYGPGAFPVAERAATEVLSLPIYPELTEAACEEVVSAVAEFYR